jgi:hypothetical protein
MGSAEYKSSGKARYFPMAGPITVYIRNRLNIKKISNDKRNS